MGFWKFKLENYPSKLKAIWADLKLDLASPKLMEATPSDWQLRRGERVAHEEAKAKLLVDGDPSSSHALRPRSRRLEALGGGGEL